MFSSNATIVGRGDFFGDIAGQKRQNLLDLNERIPMVMVLLFVDGRGDRIDGLKLRLAEGNHNLFPARYGVDDNEDYLGLARFEYRSLYVVVSS
jgi:hypothetical protein